MWILKGTLLGTGAFSSGVVLFLYFAVLRPIARTTGGGDWEFIVSIDVLKGHTVNSPFFWVAFAACVALGCALFGAMPAHRFPVH
jgi:hypothetical protein